MVSEFNEEQTVPCACGNKISLKRFNAGYNYCTECGERLAQEEIKRKAKCVAPAYNKGPLMYVSPGTDPASLGRKQ